MSNDKIFYSPSFFQDGPDNERKVRSQRPALYSSLLMIWRGSGARGKCDCVEFTGVTRDEADGKMVAWIESTGAVERPERTVSVAESLQTNAGGAA